MPRQYQLHSRSNRETSGIDYQKELNEQQYAAVCSPPGPALVIAGAGSGKTRTLTYRVAYLLDQGVDPQKLLLLTFTNKAAREMLERVNELVARDLSGLWSGTFHSIGNRILRRHAEEVGLTRSFSIMDRDDQKSIVSTIIKECKFELNQRKFPKADVLISAFSLCDNTGADLEEVLQCRYPYFEDWIEEISEVRNRYQERKLESNSVDFDDLLLLPLRLLKENEDLLKLYQERFQYLLVDEYQDTNFVQCELIDLLALPKKSLMVVGDDAQSIYSWRGADMDNILSFPEKYPDAQIFKIETNYRSVPEVLNLSNAAISANAKQFKKELKAFRQSGSMIPALVAVEDPRAQAEFVAQRIQELQEEDADLGEIAILYRAHHQSLEVQMELASRGLPFEITSGLRFFEQAHVKDVAAFLRFVVNPKDEVSYKRMCSLLPGVGAATAQKLWKAWLKTDLSNSKSPPLSFSDQMLSFPVPAKAKSDWEQLCYTLDELVIEGGFAHPSSMIRSVMEGVYDEFMRISFENYEYRRQDLEQLATYSEGFDDILELLAQLSLMNSADGDVQAQSGQDQQIVLSSIHQAKGLEWKIVFLIWMTDGMFPNGRILESDDIDMFEEERRLFYVALTRSKDQLYLIYPQINPKSYSGDVITRPSRFLDDCPEEMLEAWEVGSVW